VDWTASAADFGQKLSLAIASNTLPDAFVCSSTYWKAASEAGQLKDLTGIFNDYASDTIKYIYDTTDGSALESCTYDGEMTGVSGVSAKADGIHVLMIRQDWLDQLGLDAPETVQDVEDVALKFKEAGLGGDKTIAILGASNNGELYSTFNSTFNCTFGFDPIFGAMNAYPGYFYQDDNGDLVYGSTTQEFRDSLELLAKWYELGLIDPELGTRTTDMEPVNAGEAGMFFGPWWNVGYGNPAPLKTIRTQTGRHIPSMTTQATGI
jgi:multiple sugar transport system substrate-binding protein/putative aldouronate transport system substrate-binding protein